MLQIQQDGVFLTGDLLINEQKFLLILASMPKICEHVISKLRVRGNK